MGVRVRSIVAAVMMAAAACGQQAAPPAPPVVAPAEPPKPETLIDQCQKLAEVRDALRTQVASIEHTVEEADEHFQLILLNRESERGLPPKLKRGPDDEAVAKLWEVLCDTAGGLWDLKTNLLEPIEALTADAQSRLGHQMEPIPVPDELNRWIEKAIQFRRRQAEQKFYADMNGILTDMAKHSGKLPPNK